MRAYARMRMISEFCLTLNSDIRLDIGRIPVLYTDMPWTREPTARTTRQLIGRYFRTKVVLFAITPTTLPQFLQTNDADLVARWLFRR